MDEYRNMTTAKVKIVFVFMMLLSTQIVAESAISKEYLDSNFKYFEKYLSHFPSDVKDSIHANKIGTDLNRFIDQIKQKKDTFSPYLFNYYLGQLYYFGFNLNIDSGWTKCEQHLLQAIEMEPDSIKPKLELAALYGNSFHPQDTSSYKRAYFSLKMLSELRKEGKDVEYPNINYNLCLTALTLGIQPLCFDAGYDFWKSMPKDSNAVNFKRLIEYKKGGCSNLSSENGRKSYLNKCFHFKVSYFDALILDFESADTSKEHMTTLNLGSPLVKNSKGALIRNAVSVSAWDLKNNDKDLKIGGIIRRFSGGKMLPRNAQIDHLRTTYEYLLGENPESFHAILTFIETKDNLYALLYVATISTFDKNLAYYLDFEKSFKIVSQLEEASPSMEMSQKKVHQKKD